MKQILLFIFIASCASTYAQTATDSTIKVSYSSETKAIKPSAFYLNDQFMGSTMWGINLKTIENVTVLKGATVVNEIEYNGKILIRTKTDYALKLIALNELKFKYTNLTGKHVLFMIDGNVVNADYDKCLVDENNVLCIFIDDINNTKEQLQVTVVKILTKTDENIKNYKEVRIRGNEMSAN